MKFSLVMAALPSLVAGHGALSTPRPRQALDSVLPPWSNWSYPPDKIAFCESGHGCGGACPVGAKNPTTPDAANASNGLACYWFSNGCTIGCDDCDGTHNHFGHGDQRFLYKGLTPAQLNIKNHNSSNVTMANPWVPEPGSMTLDPSTTKGLGAKSMCPQSARTNATICAAHLRTLNTEAACGSAEDFYYFSPWRAPGAAPVIDACGTAGGRHPGQGIGPAGASFENSSLAKQGDRGSLLPAMAPQATWKAGGAAEVGWTLMAHHGGGYAYRLCPADQPLTEACFRRTPLDFVDGTGVLRWDGDSSKQLVYNATRVSTGTVPAGSTWARSPIARAPSFWQREGPSFEPVCEESQACKDSWRPGSPAPAGVCKCTGHSNGGPLLPSLEVVDTLRIPAALAPGHYVLQWRWDCEETDQIWASCADVEIE